MKEELDDIVEQIANWAGVYGACRHSDTECSAPDHCCRSCWTANLKSRIMDSIEVQAAFEMHDGLKNAMATLRKTPMT